MPRLCSSGFVVGVKCFHQYYQTTHLVTPFQQFVDHPTPKKSGGAGYQNNQSRHSYDHSGGNLDRQHESRIQVILMKTFHPHANSPRQRERNGPFPRGGMLGPTKSRLTTLSEMGALPRASISSGRGTRCNGGKSLHHFSSFAEQHGRTKNGVGNSAVDHLLFTRRAGRGCSTTAPLRCNTATCGNKLH